MQPSNNTLQQYPATIPCNNTLQQYPAFQLTRKSWHLHNLALALLAIATLLRFPKTGHHYVSLSIHGHPVCGTDPHGPGVMGVFVFGPPRFLFKGGLAFGFPVKPQTIWYQLQTSKLKHCFRASALPLHPTSTTNAFLSEYRADPPKKGLVFTPTQERATFGDDGGRFPQTTLQKRVILWMDELLHQVS